MTISLQTINSIYLFYLRSGDTDAAVLDNFSFCGIISKLSAFNGVPAEPVSVLYVFNRFMSQKKAQAPCKALFCGGLLYAATLR
jgi:hypothetical protein